MVSHETLKGIEEEKKCFFWFLKRFFSLYHKRGYLVLTN